MPLQVTHAVFRNYEPQKSVFPALSAVVIVPAGIVAFHNKWHAAGILEIYSVYLLALCTSVVLYRISPFHPLAKYPGPIWLRISKLPVLWIVYKGEYHLLLQRAHEQYGHVVRVGMWRNYQIFTADYIIY